MKYYSRVRVQNRAKIWSLFERVNEIPKNHELYSVEIIRAAYNNSINFDEPFNLIAYNNATHATEMQREHKNSIGKFGLVDDVFSEPAPAGCVSPEDVARIKGIDPNASLLASEEADRSFVKEIAASEIRRIAHKYRHLDFDLVTALYNVLRGYQPAIDRLREFTREYPEHGHAIIDFLKEHNQND